MSTNPLDEIRGKARGDSLGSRVYRMLNQEIDDYLSTRYWLRKKCEQQAEQFERRVRRIREGDQIFKNNLHDFNVNHDEAVLERIERTIVWLCITLEVEREWQDRLIDYLRLENSLEDES